MFPFVTLLIVLFVSFFSYGVVRDRVLLEALSAIPVVLPGVEVPTVGVVAAVSSAVAATASGTVKVSPVLAVPVVTSCPVFLTISSVDPVVPVRIPAVVIPASSSVGIMVAVPALSAVVAASLVVVGSTSSLGVGTILIARAFSFATRAVVALSLREAAESRRFPLTIVV